MAESGSWRTLRCKFSRLTDIKWLNYLTNPFCKWKVVYHHLKLISLSKCRTNLLSINGWRSQLSARVCLFVNSFLVLVVFAVAPCHTNIFWLFCFASSFASRDDHLVTNLYYKLWFAIRYSKSWNLSSEQFSHFNVFFHSKGDCLSFCLVNSRQNNLSALALSHGIGTATKCFLSWHSFTSCLSNRQSGVSVCCLWWEAQARSQMTKYINFPHFTNEPRLMSAIQRVVMYGDLTWQNNKEMSLNIEYYL